MGGPSRIVGDVGTGSGSEAGSNTPAGEDRQPEAARVEMRELAREECLCLLAAHHFGRMAVSMGTGPPLIRPVNYLFDERSQSVVFRTAPGSKFHALIHSADAVFEIDGIDERMQMGWSVIIRGVVEEVTNPSELRRLDALGFESWAPGPKPHWFRIAAWTVSGRRIETTGASTAG